MPLVLYITSLLILVATLLYYEVLGGLSGVALASGLIALIALAVVASIRATHRKWLT